MQSRLQDNVIDLDKTEKYILSIRLQPDGFSFSVHDPLTDGSFYFQQEQFDESKSYCEALQDAVYANEILLKDYRKIYVLISSSRFTLLPESLADGENLESCYNFCFPSHQEKILANKLPRNGCYTVFGLNADVYSFLSRTFANPVFIHHLSPLCEYFFSKSGVGNYARMFIQLQKDRIDIICYNNRNLAFANTFVCSSAPDMAYYILNVWQQLKMDQEKDELLYAGTDVHTDALLAILKRYIANMEPLVLPQRILELGKETVQAPFDLNILTICEL